MLSEQNGSVHHSIRRYFVVYLFFFGIGVEVTLNKDNRRALVAAAARKIAEGADEIGELTGRSTLARHTAF